MRRQQAHDELVEIVEQANDEAIARQRQQQVHDEAIARQQQEYDEETFKDVLKQEAKRDAKQRVKMTHQVKTENALTRN